MPHAWVTVGYGHWGYMRRLSAELGTRLDESKGLFRRTFTFHGTDDQVRRAYAAFEALRQAVAASKKLRMSERKCCYLQSQASDPITPCGKDAEWELHGSSSPNEPVDACTAHVGDLLDDSPETRVYPITP